MPRIRLKPGFNEIDLRFRRQMRAPKEVSIHVCYLGDVGNKQHGQGAIFMGRAAGISDRYRVTVYDDVQLAPGIENSTAGISGGQRKHRTEFGPDERLVELRQKRARNLVHREHKRSG